MNSRLLSEIRLEENRLYDVWDSLRLAIDDFEIAVTRYTALRDVFSERFRESPTALLWQSALDSGMDPPEIRTGKFRFIGMTPGESVVAVLKERGANFEDVIDILTEGGFYIKVAIEPTISKRGTNAALLNTHGVVKFPDGKYRYVGELHRQILMKAVEIQAIENNVSHLQKALESPAGDIDSSSIEKEIIFLIEEIGSIKEQVDHDNLGLDHIESLLPDPYAQFDDWIKEFEGRKS